MDLQEQIGKMSFSRMRVEWFDDVADIWDRTTPLKLFARLRDNAGQRSSAIAVVWGKMYESISRGETFLKAVGPYITQTNRMILSAYDDIPEGLKMAARVDKQVAAIKATMQSALLYPSATFISALGVMVFFTKHVFVALASIRPIALWPWWAQLFVWLGEMLAANAHYIVLLGSVGLTAWLSTLPTHVGERRKALDKWLPYRIYLRYHGAIFLVVLAAQMQTKGSMTSALKRVGEYASPWLRMYVDDMIARFEQPTRYGLGDRPLAALDVGLIAPAIMDRLDLLAESGAKPEEALTAVGIEMGDKLVKQMQAGAKVAGTVSFLFIGIVIVWLLLTLSVPMTAAMDLIDGGVSAARKM